MPFIHFGPKANNFGRSSSKLPTLPNRFTMKSIFSNNAAVCYKPHSLAPGGVGTVRNSGLKSRKT